MKTPPNTVWILVESHPMGLSSASLTDGHRQITLECDRWHCLPGDWRPAIAALVERQKRAGDFAGYDIQVWQPDH